MATQLLAAPTMIGAGVMRRLGRRDDGATLTADTYRDACRRVAEALGARHGQTTFVARIEHGRWLADCPCGAGLAVHPEWSEAGCLECGRWGGVAVPTRWREIETVLVERPALKNRGWIPGETVEDLDAENVARGVRAARR